MSRGGAIIAKVAAEVDTRDLQRMQREMQTLTHDITNTGKTHKSVFAGVAMGTIAANAAMSLFHSAVSGVSEAIQEAAAEQTSAAVSAQNLTNMGLKPATEAVLNQLDAYRLMYGFSENQLRPGFDSLVRATGNVKQAMYLTNLAMNITRGTGRDYSTVIAALTKGASGNWNALARMNTGLSQTIIKTKDAKLITGELAKMFKGDAATYANTYAGQLDRLNEASKMLKVSVGKGVLDALNEVAKAFHIGTTNGKFFTAIQTLVGKATLYTAATLLTGAGAIWGLAAAAQKTAGSLGMSFGSIMTSASKVLRVLSYIPGFGSLSGQADKAYLTAANMTIAGIGLKIEGMHTQATAKSLTDKGSVLWNKASTYKGTDITVGAGTQPNSTTPPAASNAAKVAAVLKQLATTINSDVKNALTTLAAKFTAAADKAKGLFDQVRGLFNLGSVQSGTDILATMTGSVSQSQAFTAALKSLKAKGLNKQSLSELYAAGPSSLAAAQNLLSQGGGAISQVNSLEAKLLASANSYSAQYGNTGGAGYGSVVNGLTAQAKAVSSTHYTIAKGAIVVNVGAGADAHVVALAKKAVHDAVMQATGGRPIPKNAKVRG